VQLPVVVNAVEVCTRAAAFGALAACKGKHAVVVNGILADEGISCAVVPVQIGNGYGFSLFVNGDVALFRTPSVVFPACTKSIPLKAVKRAFHRRQL